MKHSIRVNKAKIAVAKLLWLSDAEDGQKVPEWDDLSGEDKKVARLVAENLIDLVDALRGESR